MQNRPVLQLAGQYDPLEISARRTQKHPRPNRPLASYLFNDPENNVIEIDADIHPRDSISAPSRIYQVTE